MSNKWLDKNKFDENKHLNIMINYIKKYKFNKKKSLIDLLFDIQELPAPSGLVYYYEQRNKIK